MRVKRLGSVRCRWLEARHSPPRTRRSGPRPAARQPRPRPRGCRPMRTIDRTLRCCFEVDAMAAGPTSSATVAPPSSLPDAPIRARLSFRPPRAVRSSRNLSHGEARLPAGAARPIANLCRGSVPRPSPSADEKLQRRYRHAGWSGPCCSRVAINVSGPPFAGPFQDMAGAIHLDGVGETPTNAIHDRPPGGAMPLPSDTEAVPRRRRRAGYAHNKLVSESEAHASGQGKAPASRRAPSLRDET
jgi:hypothetical protein